MLSRARGFASIPAMIEAASSHRAAPHLKKLKWVAPSLTTVAVFAAWGYDLYRDHVIDSAFENDSAPKPLTHGGFPVILRDELNDSLASILSSPPSNNRYAFVSGSHGTGKVCYSIFTRISTTTTTSARARTTFKSFYFYLLDSLRSYGRHLQF